MNAIAIGTMSRPQTLPKKGDRVRFLDSFPTLGIPRGYTFVTPRDAHEDADPITQLGVSLGAIPRLYRIYLDTPARSRESGNMNESVMATLDGRTFEIVNDENTPALAAVPAPAREAATVGLKADDGKLPWELMPEDALEEIVRVLALGAKKYAPRNWEKGIKHSRLYGTMRLHLKAWWQDGQNTDPETNLRTLAHLACEVLFALAFEARGMGKDWDDRPTRIRPTLSELAAETGEDPDDEDEDEDEDDEDDVDEALTDRIALDLETHPRPMIFGMDPAALEPRAVRRIMPFGAPFGGPSPTGRNVDPFALLARVLAIPPRRSTTGKPPYSDEFMSLLDRATHEVDREGHIFENTDAHFAACLDHVERLGARADEVARARDDLENGCGEPGCTACAGKPRNQR